MPHSGSIGNRVKSGTNFLSVTKGGQKLSHSELDMEIVWSFFWGIILAVVVPVYAFFILKRKQSVENAGAISAAYGSVSAVTFVTTVSYLEAHDIFFSGHMVAVTEAPSIIVGVLLIFPVQQRTGFQTLLSGYPASFFHQWLRHPDFGKHCHRLSGQ